MLEEHRLPRKKTHPRSRKVGEEEPKEDEEGVDRRDSKTNPERKPRSSNRRSHPNINSPLPEVDGLHFN